MITLTGEKNNSYKKQYIKVYYICKKGCSIDDDNKKYHKIRDIVTTQENIEKLLIAFVIEDIRHKKKFL